MATDLTPYQHAVAAVATQALFGLATGGWVLGGLVGCAWFIAREHTQAEYRWIAAFADGKRAAMPWWGGFDPRAWSLDSLLDWLVPVLACAGVALAAHFST
jgi:hypothetical protein